MDTKAINRQNMTDAEHLKTVRKALHLTQEEMAQKMGYSSQEVISAIEIGKRKMSGVARENLRMIEKYEIGHL